MTPSLYWRGKSWKGPVRNGRGRSLGTENSRKGQAGRRGQGAGSTCTAVAGTQKGRGKEKNAGEWGLGDSQVRVGREGGGEVNADEARTAKSLEGWQL